MLGQVACQARLKKCLSAARQQSYAHTAKLEALLTDAWERHTQRLADEAACTTNNQHKELVDEV